MSNTVLVRKRNKIKHVDKDRLEAFLSQGYDQIDNAGNVVKDATGGKEVTYGEFLDVKKEKAALQKQLDESNKALSESQKELAAIKKELNKEQKEETKKK